jgi:hypothetical protein
VWCENGSILQNLVGDSWPRFGCNPHISPLSVKLHNSLLMSMIVMSRSDPAFDPNAGSNLPARKRRRLMPHQDPPPRLRRWIVGIRKQERERLRALGSSGSTPRATWRDDEMSLERAIMLRPEGKSKLPYNGMRSLSLILFEFRPSWDSRAYSTQLHNANLTQPSKSYRTHFSHCVPA